MKLYGLQIDEMVSLPFNLNKIDIMLLLLIHSKFT